MYVARSVQHRQHYYLKINSKFIFSESSFIWLLFIHAVYTMYILCNNNSEEVIGTKMFYAPSTSRLYRYCLKKRLGILNWMCVCVRRYRDPWKTIFFSNLYTRVLFESKWYSIQKWFSIYLCQSNNILHRIYALNMQINSNVLLVAQLLFFEIWNLIINFKHMVTNFILRQALLLSDE